MRAGKHVVTANKQLLSQHGEELWARAREHGVQLRFEAAVAGVVPVIRVLQESLAAAHVERIHGIVNGTTNFILTEMARTRRAPTRRRSAEAQELGYAEADPTDDVTGSDAAAKMAILARLAFATPVHLDQVGYEGIEHITADDIAYAQRARPRAEADRHGRARRRRASACACTRRSSTPGHPLASVNGPFNAVTIESDAITEITLSGPGAGGPQTASAVLGDVICAMIPPASHAGDDRGAARSSTTSSRRSTCTWRSPTGPACSPRSPRCSACRARRSSRSCSSGLGDNARLVMVMHPLLESRFYAARAADRRGSTSCAPRRARSA